MLHINNNTRPLIFLGSNNVMEILTELCDRVNIKVAGIIDKDYWSNQHSICDVPVIDSEECFLDSAKLANYKKNFHFFCATNWIPEKTEVAQRNCKKRLDFLSLIRQHDLPCISLVDPDAKISKSAVVGTGTFVDANVHLNPKVKIADFVAIYHGATIGPYTQVGDNCVIQRDCFITHGCTVETNCYFGLCSKMLKEGAKFGSGTFVHEALYVRRGTVENETVSLHGSNTRRIGPYPAVV